MRGRRHAANGVETAAQEVLHLGQSGEPGRDGHRAQQAADRERIPARRPVVVAPPPPPPRPSGSVFKKWWFWTAVGGVAVAATVVGIVVASSGGTELGRDPGGQVVLQF